MEGEGPESEAWIGIIGIGILAHHNLADKA